MNENAEKHLNKAMGLTDASKILREQGINALTERLRKEGEQAKGMDKPDPAAAPAPGSVPDFEPLLKRMLDAIGDHEMRITQMSDGEASRVKAVNDTVTPLTEKLDTVQKGLAGLEAWRKQFLADTPRQASTAAETQLQGGEEADAKNRLKDRTEPTTDPAFPGMGVPLPGNQNGAH